MAISASLLEQIEQQWQADDFFGRSDYPDILDVAPEGWRSDGEPDPVAGVDELFLEPRSDLKKREL